ncbi:hypothetical protein HOD08_03210 [bacterium]|nr:hypothetical protein [bacterium]
MLNKKLVAVAIAIISSAHAAHSTTVLPGKWNLHRVYDARNTLLHKGALEQKHFMRTHCVLRYDNGELLHLPRPIDLLPIDTVDLQLGNLIVLRKPSGKFFNAGSPGHKAVTNFLVIIGVCEDYVERHPGEIINTSLSDKLKQCQHELGELEREMEVFEQEINAAEQETIQADFASPAHSV